MGSQEVLESVAVANGTVTSCGGGLEQPGCGVKRGETLGDDLLEDLDSYLEDINDRLLISRMVSDSVIRGMVNAIEQEATETITAKELEVAGLMESLQFHNVGSDKIESSGSPVIQHEPESINYGQYSCFSDACLDQDKMTETLGSLRKAAREQFKKFKKEIDGIRGCSSLRRISSGSELVGLGGILQEKASESWVGVDKMLDTLKKTVDGICTRVDDILHFSKTSLCEWQQERELQGELEAMVIQSSIRSLQEEFEEKLWDENARFCGSQSVNWLEKLNEISGLRKELEAILKSLSNPETGQLVSNGSHDMDHFHREGNRKFEESKTGVPENFDAAQLKHMSKEDLVNYFNTMITNMRRDHESKVQEMTEEHFRLKGEYLREKGSYLPFKKDKEFDILKKKIPEVILKLDDILVENEKVRALNGNVESLGSLKDRLDSVLSENRQLRDSLTDKKNEVKCLSSQVPDTAEKMLRHSLAKADLQELIGNLYSAIEDACIEASVSEEVYKCVFRELSGQIKCDTEESEMEFIIMHEIYGIIFREFVHDADTSNKREIENSEMESMIMQGLDRVIFGETIKDAEGKLKKLNVEYLTENENRVSLERKASEKENELRLEVKEKKRLKQEVLLLKMSMEEKEKLATEASAALMKEKEQFELASQELNHLRDHASEQQKLISGQKAKEKEHRKQIEVLIVLVQGLSKALADFECRVTEDIKTNNLRLEHSSSQLSSLIKEANILRRTGLLYKEGLERRCSDLQMAEAEVDLLGDEVDEMLSLLEKIYIALDHYSPILQHYPGIVETLKLVKRELSGESTKSV